MKIFVNKQDKCNVNRVSPVRKLLENNMSLREKMLMLQNSLQTIKYTPNGENEFLSIIFDAMGCDIHFPRKGDNSERFDVIINFSEYKVVSEVEIPSTEILDAPRNLLDDYAVLHSRNGESKSKIVPLVICWNLPNKRTDYWNVISDVEKVLNLKIKTISVLALAFYYWTGIELDLTGDDFYLSYENTSMEKTIELLNENGLSPDNFPGFFIPQK